MSRKNNGHAPLLTPFPVLTEPLLSYTKPDPVLDWTLLAWYADMVARDELQWTFFGQATPGHFLSCFHHGTTLIFQEDTRGVTRAIWTEPFLQGAFLGLYFREDIRQQRQSFAFLTTVYALVFQRFPTILGLVADQRPDKDRLLNMHRKLGYSKGLALPHVLHGHAVHLVSITKAMWDAACSDRHRSAKEEA